MKDSELASKAMDSLGKFCKGTNTMSIPVQDSDDDQVIFRALDRLRLIGLSLELLETAKQDSNSVKCGGCTIS